MNEDTRIHEVDVETAIELSDGLSVVLTDACRKQLLSALSSGSGRQTLESLAADIDPVSLDTRSEPATVDQLAFVLHHCHLPKLEDYGLVEYDSDRLEAGLTPKGAQCVEIFGEMRTS
jgi:hypothetical protein